MKDMLKSFFTLSRIPIGTFTAYSTLTAALARGASVSAGIIAAAAVFVLAAGASALNQVQERDIDARMERTRTRPLPSGKISVMQAIFFALLLVGTGLGLLASLGRVPFILGSLALVWYNGIYTGLKRKTAFAAVPGAVVGMIPPAIGWTAAGGGLFDPRIFALCFLFFMWQVPHFWLQLLHHGEEYEKAGLPSLTAMLSRKQLARMAFAWICASAVSGLLLAVYGTIQSPVLCILLVPAAVLLIVRGRTLLFLPSRDAGLPAFRMVNLYIVFVMTLLPAGSFLSLAQ